MEVAFSCSLKCEITVAPESQTDISFPLYPSTYVYVYIITLNYRIISNTAIGIMLILYQKHVENYFTFLTLPISHHPLVSSIFLIPLVWSIFGWDKPLSEGREAICTLDWRLQFQSRVPCS